MYEQVSEIQFALEFYLEDGALDGFSTEEAQWEIGYHMGYPFGHLNPFRNPNTGSVTVKIYKMEVCENGRQTEKTVARVNDTFINSATFYGNWVETVHWTSKKTQKLEKNLVEAAVNLLKPRTESLYKTLFCSEWNGFSDEILSKMTLRNPLPGTFVTPVFADRSSSFELHRWMAHLSTKMRKVPFTMLAIPGSHNSATHTMREDEALPYGSPLSVDYVWYGDFANYDDFTNYVNDLTNHVDDLKSFVTSETLASWGRSVKYNISEQLEMGIRYFDFRLKFLFLFSFCILFFRPQKYFTEGVWNAHYLYATKVSDELVVIKDFLAKYPTEVVILHMNHGWQGMEVRHFEQLNRDIKQM